ncbi:MAG TPA: DUF1080 domain-containing protein [Candidatus Hydrogenedentes bacterium]|nr:DUF1080 domain-containing protein [Candidatus Hydrogenedentota bacterium]
MKRFLSPLIIVLLAVCSIAALAQNVLLEPDIDGAAAAARNDPAARRTLEAECIAALTESTPFPERYRALRILAIIGGGETVAPVAALLNDAHMGHLARNTLEAIHSEQAAQALRDALNTTTGAQRLGVINSLARLRDAEAVAALCDLTNDQDTETAMTAVNALGHIATPEAVATLEALLNSSDPDLRLAGAQSLLLAAQHLDKDGRTAIYDKLTGDIPDYIRAGAFRASLEAQPEKALDNVIRAIQQDDELLQLTAIAALTRLSGADVTQRLGELLPSLAGDRQALILNALAEREDASLPPLLHNALTNESEEVRIAAMRAIAAHGNEHSIDPLCRIIGRESSRQEKMAAVETLRRLPGANVDAALIERLPQAPEAVRGDLMDVLAQRNAEAAVDAIIAQVKHESLRPAAFRALTHIMPADRLPEMLALLGNLEGDIGRPEAEGALAALCQRIAQREGRLEITKALYGDLPDGPSRDVTNKVAQSVKGGTLSIEANNSNLGDAAPNVVKKLRVDYTLNGAAGSKTVHENQRLTLQSETLPPALSNTLAKALDNASTPAEKVSLLRVLSRMGGADAYELVTARLAANEPSVRDGAIRALSNWPDTQAINALVDVFAGASETAHRMAALRGCVRLLRLGELDTAATLSVYEQLAESAQTGDERKMLLAGLAEVNSPEAITLVTKMLEDDSVQAEATMAIQRIGDAAGMTEAQVKAAAEKAAARHPAGGGGFTPLFDGKTLDGWAGEPALWRVEDGHIIGETTKENPAKVNTFLIWEGGEIDDFELTFRYKLESEWANSGMQIRSERFDGFRVRGYQADIANEDWITGICYEEGGRGILARRGQKAVLGDGDAKETTQFADEKELADHIKGNDWNEYHIVAKGNRFVSSINGHKMHEIVDNSSKARLKGILAFQLHVGEPMKIRISDIMLKRLSGE